MELKQGVRLTPVEKIIYECRGKSVPEIAAVLQATFKVPFTERSVHGYITKLKASLGLIRGPGEHHSGRRA